MTNLIVTRAFTKESQSLKMGTGFSSRRKSQDEMEGGIRKRTAIFHIDRMEFLKELSYTVEADA